MLNELLAPAGNLEAVKVAIDNGADAVYCAGKRFGARSFIANLSREDIIEASRYSHLRGKKIYITLNTLVFEEELEEAKEYIDFLYLHVDAIIVQDYGIVHYIRSKYPDFPVHLSTQTSIHNEDDLRLLKELGIARVILAREVSLEELTRFQKVGVELEVFIHGALCFCYSGMCYMSYYHGGRSGNRGSCAQPCRQEYELLEDGKPIAKGALLSMKDLCFFSDFPKLLHLGVASLKIEGRAKSLEYLASSVRIYRELIDSYNEGKETKVDQKKLEDLLSSYSRETTKGYMNNEDNADVVTSSTVKHRGLKIGEVVASYQNQCKIRLFKELSLNDGIRIEKGSFEMGFLVTRLIEGGKMVSFSSLTVIVDTKGKVPVGAYVYKTSSSKVSKSIKENAPEKIPARLSVILTRGGATLLFETEGTRVERFYEGSFEPAKSDQSERIKSQFGKLGQLPFFYEEIALEDKEGLFIPVTEMNRIRGEFLSIVEEELSNRKVRVDRFYPFAEPVPFCQSKERERLALSYSGEGDIKMDDHLIYGSPLRKEAFAFHLAEIGESSVLSPYLGICNSSAISFFRHLSKDIIILGYESTLENSVALAKIDANLGYLVDFREPLMVSKHCVVSARKGHRGKGCGECYKHSYQLLSSGDRMDLRFHSCIMHIEGERIIRKEGEGLIPIALL